MTTIILVLHIFLAAAMIGLILIQRNEGGALGMGGSTMGGLMSTRGTANLLTRTTALLVTCFFITTLVLALLFKGSQKKVSLLDQDSLPISVDYSPTSEEPQEGKAAGSPLEAPAKASEQTLSTVLGASDSKNQKVKSRAEKKGESQKPAVRSQTGAAERTQTRRTRSIPKTAEVVQRQKKLSPSGSTSVSRKKKKSLSSGKKKRTRDPTFPDSAKSLTIEKK